MNKNKVASNYIFSLFYQIVIIVVPLITTPYISRVLGVEGIGIYSYCLSISTYFIIIGMMGIPLYGQREIAYNRENKQVRSKTFVEIFICQCIGLCISLVIFFIVFVLLKNQYSLMFLTVGIGIVASVFDITWFFGGLEEYKIVVARNFFIKVITIVLIFSLVKNKNDLYVYALCIMMGNFVGNISTWFCLPKYMKKIRLKDLEIKKNIKPALLLLIPSSITTIYAVIDKTMLGILSNSMYEVGYYEQSQKIIIFSTAIVTSLGTVLMPRLAFAFHNNNSNEIKKYIENVIEFVLFITLPIMFGLIAVSDNLVPWFFGTSYNKVSILIKFFSPLALLIGLNSILGNQYFVAIKKEKLLIKITLIGTICNCLFNALLIPYYKSVGAAAATIFGELVKLLIILYFIKDIIEITIIPKFIFKYLSHSIFMYLIINITEKYFIKEAKIYNTIILIVVGIITYMVPLWIRKDKFIMMLFGYVKSKINKR